MHQDIVRFTEEGFLRDDSDFIRLKDEFTRILEEKMRDQGFIPHIDINVEWSTWFIEKEKRYGFKISLYGVEVGEENCSKGAVFSEGKIFRMI